MTRALLLILLLPTDTAVVNIPTPEQAQCRVQLVMRLAMTESEQRGICARRTTNPKRVQPE